MNSREIILQVNEVDQLLIEPDSLFYNKRRLKPEAEEFIIEEAKIAGPNNNFLLNVHLGKDEKNRKDEILPAIHQHFNYRLKRSERELNRVLQLGWQSLLISIVFLGIIVMLTLIIIRLLPEGGLSITVRELLIILGWVALWRPIDFLLYEWRPFKREVKLFRKLEQCQVEILINRSSNNTRQGD